MRLTPLDIRKQEFKRTLRGFDAEEVQSFLQMVSSQWDELQAEHRRLEQKVGEMDNKLHHYLNVEEALQEALRTARESSRQTIDTAKQQADSILKDAERHADEIRRTAEQDRKMLRREATEIRSKRNEIVARLRSFLHSEMEVLSRFESDHPLDADASDAIRRVTSERGIKPSNRDAIPEQQALKNPERENDFLYYDNIRQAGQSVTASEENDDSAMAEATGEDQAEEARPSGGWVVHPVISAPVSTVESSSMDEGEQPEMEVNQEDPQLPASASADELDRIRRILKDLD